MYFVFAAKFANYSKYFCKCSMLIENPCARVPGYAPELARSFFSFNTLLFGISSHTNQANSFRKYHSDVII